MSLIDLILAISLANKELCVVESNQYVVECFDIAIGKNTTPTTIGSFYITNIVDNPQYVDAVGVNHGHGVLGDLAIVTNLKTTQGLDLALHGTNQPHLIGQAVSSGCIRMSNKDIRTLDHFYLKKITSGTIT